jgi:hypothetical protein
LWNKDSSPQELLVRLSENQQVNLLIIRIDGGEKSNLRRALVFGFPNKAQARNISS